MKKILLIILGIFIVSAGVVFALQNKQTENKGALNMTDKKILVVYFSRTGEQYSVGNITEGNTAIIAKMIAEKTNGDLFEIKVKNDNYPKGYTELTEYAKSEKQQNARPAIMGDVNIDNYDTVFIGYPNWWAKMPMPVYSFMDSYDLTNKKVYHFCTHEGSGGVKKEGFAIYGHIAQNNRAEAEKQVSEWLKGVGF